MAALSLVIIAHQAKPKKAIAFNRVVIGDMI